MTEPANASVEPRAAVLGTQKVCGWCHKPFTPYRSWDVFCEPSHKRAAEKASKRLGQMALGLVPRDPSGARNTDPQSSHDAAIEAGESGNRERDEQRALKLVTWNPGLSAYELATVAVSTVPHWWGTDHPAVYHAIARRLGKLREQGKLSNRRDLDAARQHAEPDRHKVEGCRGRPVEWWPAAAKQEAA